MRYISALFCAGCTATLLAVSFARAESIPIVNIDPSQITSAFPTPPGKIQGGSENHYNGVVGWRFTLLQPVTVTQVGWYDDGLDGLSRDFQVGLWGPGGQRLGDPTSGITIPGGTVAALNGVWRVIDLPSPLDLQAGSYAIAGLDTASTPDVIKATNAINLDPLVTGGRLKFEDIFHDGSIGNPGFHAPTSSFLVPGVEFGPTLFISVPEPSMLFLTLAAFAMLACEARKSRVSN
jgi:hypothetical protein